MSIDLPATAIDAFVDLEPPLEDFREQVFTGLNAPQKQIPAKFFYDEAGSRLFERICELKEYYLTRTEEAILSELRDVIKRRTTILISHRVSTVKDADAIYVLDEGRLVEQGDHDYLVQQGGIYAEMYRKQLLEQELEEA